MDIYLHRQYKQSDYSVGLLFFGKSMPVFTLEDEKRDVKLKHETRIPAGRYEIKLRTSGGMNEKYKKVYKFHRGMLWLQNVPNFEFIYIHVGNNDDHTSGCILVGCSHLIGENKILFSALAYQRLYEFIISCFDKGEKVFINVVDELIF